MTNNLPTNQQLLGGHKSSSCVLITKVEQQKRNGKTDDHVPNLQPNKSSKSLITGRQQPLNKLGQEDSSWQLMTPPSISGTSLAPLADTDRTDNHLIANSNPGAATLPPMAATIPTIRTVLRKVPHTKQPCGVPHTGAPLTFASKAAAAAEGHKGLGGACWGDNELQLVAEGKSIARGGQVSIDPRLMMYMEINENDSLCGTPPCLSLSVTHCDAMHGPFGPLSHVPLSPSLLTLCGDLGEMGVGGEEASGRLWDTFGGLPDMRVCSGSKISSN